jgi:hypothetical protein
VRGCHFQHDAATTGTGVQLVVVWYVLMHVAWVML